MAGKYNASIETFPFNSDHIQVQIFAKFKKKVTGQIHNEKLAAQIYDKQLILNSGLKAKTNFDYTKKQLDRLLQRENDFNFDESDSGEAEITGEANQTEQLSEIKPHNQINQQQDQ